MVQVPVVNLHNSSKVGECLLDRLLKPLFRWEFFHGEIGQPFRLLEEMVGGFLATLQLNMGSLENDGPEAHGNFPFRVGEEA